MSATRVVLLCVVAAVMASSASADYPLQMNYQVMLTDDLDQPLVNETVTMVFTIYDADVGGSAWWTETRSVTTNSIGVASVVLGEVTPIDGFFTFDQTWLEVEVDGEVMSPRRPLTESPYARVALWASEAFNAEALGGTEAGEYALYAHLSSPGTLNNPSNPLEWTKLKNVPAGFADGVDNTGPGDGHSLDASDGSPIDALYVDEEGRARLGPPAWLDSRFSVESSDDVAASFVSRNESPTVLAYNLDESSASPRTMVVCLGDSFPSTSPTYPTAFIASTHFDAGGTGDATAALFSGYGGLPTLQTKKLTGDGSALYSEVMDFYGATGFSGHFIGGDGVFIERDESYQALEVVSNTTGAAGDAVWISTASGAASNTWALYSTCYQGEAGRFSKYFDDDQYTARVLGPSVSSKGLYVQGTLVYTGTAARSVETSRGREAVYAVSAPESEVVASGTAHLAGGSARVEFDRLFAEAIDGTAGIRVTATPTGAWSALYTESIDEGGFEVRSGAGASDVEFHWMAFGRAADWESSRSLVLPDPEEDARLAAEKEAENLRRRPDDELQVIYRDTHGR